MINYQNMKGHKWKKEIDVLDFIKNNYEEYLEDDSFLVKPTNKTQKLLQKVNVLLEEELKKGVLDVETTKFSGINNFEAGYIDQENEVIFGLQTDKPLKRIVNPYGGYRMAVSSLEMYNYNYDTDLFKHFKEFRKTHNDGVYDAYTEEIRKCRKVGLLTGLPDSYGRGRIIGDYRRVALYGVDYLIKDKQKDLSKITEINEENIRLREEVNMQIKALNELKEMALKYGFDLSNPASNAKEAVQYVYFAYLASVKENNGAAMSLGRISTFLDIYLTNDLKDQTITEQEAQELIDQLVIKLRLVRHLRTKEYDELFAGDPTWITESIGGMLNSTKSFVTKTSYRFLHTLTNLNPAPEPNMTILWADKLPTNFKKYCAKMSIATDSIQYENDDLMRPIYGSDYGIACCVSAMRLGKDMQFFGARCNLAKSLLYAINGGIDEISGQEVLEDIPKIEEEYLSYRNVYANYKNVLSKVAKIYVDAMNIIHYMHDKYSYEAIQLALHDTDVNHLMAFGVAGLSIVADSLSAIKYGRVKVVRNKEGLAVDFINEKDFPTYGNDNDAVDNIAKDILEIFIKELRKHRLYKNAKHTLSVLTITSNVVYGKKTGSTPDGRQKGEPFAPGANPMHGRDKNGALASLNSVAKLPYQDVCEDGISNTFSIIPSVLGQNQEEQINNLYRIINGYFKQNAHHINVNVLNKETLKDAMIHPELYPNLTIRVSGYAVKFIRLTKEQQEEVLKRTFHEQI